MTAAPADPELRRLLAANDRRAAAALLVRGYAADVYACCRALVGDPAAAEDLSQDVFSKAIAALDGFRQEASARTWLLRIARNCCFDHLARLRRQPWGAEEDEEAADPDRHPDEAPPVWELLSRREDAERALGALAEAERAIVVLHFGHGVGYPELAAAFALREGAVRMRVSRALSRMRAALEPSRAAPAPAPAMRARLPGAAPARAAFVPAAPVPAAPVASRRGDPGHLLHLPVPATLEQRLAVLVAAA